jgi:two-component system phosphate regulon response regulator PhoB
MKTTTNGDAVMAGESILVVEDDRDIQKLIEYNLTRERYRVECVPNGELALKVIGIKAFKLCLLDIMLPGFDGLEVCRAIKGDLRKASMPVIMVTAKGEESDIVTGLELGADDYVVKPFSPKVLVAKIRTVLRRRTKPGAAGEQPVDIHNVMIHPGRREVAVDGKRIDLTYAEFQLLYYLASRPGWVFSRDQIINAINGEDYVVTDRAVDVHVVNLRRKLGDRGGIIETVRGMGYRFSDYASIE